MKIQFGKGLVNMACSLYMIAVVVIMGRVASGQLEVTKDDNIEPFAFLCRIYNVAKNPPITDVDMDEGYNIVNEIDALNRSLFEEKREDETEDAVNHSEAQVKPIFTREAALAQLSLNQITQRAHKILEEIKKVNVTKAIEKAKDEFHKVIFGEDGNESNLCQATVKGVGNRATACGDTGLSSKGTSAGKNLVVDFFCLCAQRQDGKGVNQVCGFYVGSGYENGQIGWNEAGTSGSSTMWASIKGGCGKHMQQHPKSTAEALHIFDQFLKHLKTGGVYRWGDISKKTVDGSERKEGMLGTGVGTKNGNGGNGKDILCNGKKGGKDQSPGGVCVYYGPESDWETNVYWIKQFRAAVANVDAVNNQTATIQRATQKLQMLLHRAEEIYETAKVMLEIKKPVGLPAALQNASVNLTAYNTTRTRSCGYSPHPHFIPELALFLL